jgi:hypothetical protein
LDRLAGRAFFPLNRGGFRRVFAEREMAGDWDWDAAVAEMNHKAYLRRLIATKAVGCATFGVCVAIFIWAAVLQLVFGKPAHAAISPQELAAMFGGVGVAIVAFGVLSLRDERRKLARDKSAHLRGRPLRLRVVRMEVKSEVTRQGMRHDFTLLCRPPCEDEPDGVEMKVCFYRRKPAVSVGDAALFFRDDAGAPPTPFMPELRLCLVERGDETLIEFAKTTMNNLISRDDIESATWLGANAV